MTRTRQFRPSSESEDRCTGVVAWIMWAFICVMVIAGQIALGMKLADMWGAQ